VEARTKLGTQVRQLVLARGYLSTSEPVAHFGFGDEQAIERLKIVWPSGREQTIANLVTGRHYTVTEPESSATEEERSPLPPPVRFEERSGAFGLGITQREEPLEGTVPQPLLPRRFNRRGPGIAVGDINGDGVDEIVLSATVKDGAKLLRREGSSYGIVDIGPVGDAPAINDGPPLIFDTNGDGANDLLFTAGGAALPAEEPEYEPRLWLNRGRGADRLQAGSHKTETHANPNTAGASLLAMRDLGFEPAPRGFLPSLPISVGAAVTADFNRDGALDLFLGGRVLPGYYPEPPTSALLLQRGGRLTDATTPFAPELREVGLVTSALASDVDGDGWIDLVVALEWGGVRFFRNQQGRALADVSGEWGFDTAGSGLWTSLAAADFNHDGRLDYALGNLGLNTVFSASREHPMRLFAGDFAGSGEPQLALAYDVDGRLVPVASRGELASKIPGVLKRFPSNNRYAAATLEEILGKESLAKATDYEAGELRSGVLLSQPSGRYAFVPLPHYAQIAPVQGMAAGDIDGDGHSDLLLATNDYSPIPALGRFDSGLGWLLRGDGSGGFAPAPAADSGWLVPGNAKALALVDLDRDGRPDAVVTRNNESTLAFRNAGVPVAGLGEAGPGSPTPATDSSRLVVAVRLHGRGGNPDAIGARIVLESGGRTLHVAEIRAGGGYASQSTATAFLSVPNELAAGATFRIRWPSGVVTQHAVPQKSGYMNISE
jgi:hypothetical protein